MQLTASGYGAFKSVCISRYWEVRLTRPTEALPRPSVELDAELEAVENQIMGMLWDITTVRLNYIMDSVG